MSSLSVTSKGRVNSAFDGSRSHPHHLPANSGRLHQLDGLRGIAMLFVFVGHFGTVWSELVHPGGAAGTYLRIVDADATLGSSFFMLLSAFFAYGSLRQPGKKFGTFLRQRLWRLYPLYLVMTAAYIAGSILIPKMSKLPTDSRDLPLFIVETLLFLPGVLHIRPLMDVAWTLSFVVLFYFVAGALAFLFRVCELSRKSRVLLLCGAAILWAVTGDHMHWWESRTAIFWVGMAISEVVEAMSGPRWGWAERLVAPGILIVVMGVLLRTALMLIHPATPFVSLAVWRTGITSVSLSAFMWVAYFGPQWWKLLLSSPRLRSLGEASYSFYLTHGIAVKIFRFGVIPLLGSVAASPPVFWASQVAGLALSVWIARVVYTFIEKPMSILVKKKTTAGSPAAGRALQISS